MNEATTEKGDATPERIAKAANDNYVGDDGARRFRDDPLTRLAIRGALYPNREINRRLHAAGERYYKDWYLSNMSPLASFDPTRVFVGGSHSTGGFPATENQMEHRRAHREASAFLGSLYAEVIDLIVLQGQGNLLEVGRKASDSASADTCRAVAIERLKAGLFLLAKHYQMVK